ncbi:protein-tyrosine-phosphatase [Vibrio cholerae]|nr:protein-tyrosine-phosphatase [Vibrio cholerae]
MVQVIEVSGLFNVRTSSPETPWLVRSGAAEGITPEGSAALKALGVVLVLDLREPSEVGLVVHGVPVQSVQLYGTEPPAIGRLEEIYESLLRERGHALTKAVSVIAEAKGGVLVHCTAGKDRTGLVVALAQLASGMPPSEVIEDYTLSAPEVRAAREVIALRVADAAPETDRAETLRLHLDSPPEAMQHALSVIEELGGAEAYLLAHGLYAGHLTTLRRKHRGT